jgi:hypothetical protein
VVLLTPARSVSFEEAAGHQLFDLQAHQLEDVAIDEIALGDGHHAGADAEELADAKCSRVCGLIDSSAAMTSSALSMPPMPASMFFTKRSWPGTSTKPIW